MISSHARKTAVLQLTRIEAQIDAATFQIEQRQDGYRNLRGEAKAVLQDFVSYEQTQESLALLKMLAQSSKSIQEGRSKPLKKAFANFRKHVREDTDLAAIAC